MAKLHKIVVKFQRNPVEVLRYDRAARGRTALIDVLLVKREDIPTFLESPGARYKMNIKATRPDAVQVTPTNTAKTGGN